MLTLVTNPARPHCFTDDDWDGWCAKWQESESRKPTRSDVCGDCADRGCPERPALQRRPNQYATLPMVTLDPDRLRTRRLALGLSQLALFRQTRISASVICNAERGHHARVRLDTARRLAESLETSVEALTC